MPTTTTGVATSFIDFTRASNATVTDSDGRVKWAPHNLLLASESFDAAAWGTTAGVTVTANSTNAPNSTTTADTLAFTTTGYHYQLVAIGSPVIGTTYTGGVWLWSTTGKTQIALRLSGVTIGADQTVQIVTLTSTPTLFTVSRTFTGGDTSIGLGIDNRTSVGADGVAGSVIAWGASLYRSDLGGMQPNTSAYPLYNPTTPKNLLGYTEDISNAAWTKSNILAFGSGSVANAILAPTGLQTADLITPDTTNNLHRVFANDPFPSSTKLLFACYAKSNGYTKLGLRETGTTGAGAAFDLTGSGSVIGAYNSGGSTVSDMVISSVGNGWFRISCVFSFASATGMRFAVNLLSPSYVSGDLSASWTANGTSGIYLWGAQLSDSASLDPYVPVYGAAVTSAAYYGPRRDFDGVTLACKGLLVEEQRSNLLLYSAQFDVSANWTASAGVSISANSTISPDGTLTADTMTSSAGNQLDQSISCSTTTVYTNSLYFKKTSGAAYQPALYLLFSGGTLVIYAVRLNTDTGVATAVSAGGFTAPSSFAVQDVGQYWRLSITGNSNNNTTVSFRLYPNLTAGGGLGGAGSQIIWGAQLEANASFATSYIPVGATSAGATRNADVASVSTQAFPYSATEGTLVVSGSPVINQNISAYFVQLASDVAGTNYGSSNAIFKGATSGLGVGQKVKGMTVTDANSFVSEVATTGDINTDVIKASYAFAANNFGLSVNGSAVIPDTSGAMPSASTVLTIGAMRGGIASFFMSGHIRQITYLPRRISNAELVTRST